MFVSTSVFAAAFLMAIIPAEIYGQNPASTAGWKKVCPSREVEIAPQQAFSVDLQHPVTLYKADKFTQVFKSELCLLEKPPIFSQLANVKCTVQPKQIWAYIIISKIEYKQGTSLRECIDVSSNLLACWGLVVVDGACVLWTRN